MRFRLLLLGVVAVAASLPLAAQEQAYVRLGQLEQEGRAWVERIECGAPVREGGRLVVRADVGTVIVKPGAADRMQCQVRLWIYAGSEAEARRFLNRFAVSVRLLEGGGVSLSGGFSPERRRSGPFKVEYEIQVPLRFNLDLETQGGALVVERLEGELRAATAGGDIRTGDIAGPVRVETAGGSIQLGNIGQRVEATTAGGSIHVGDIRGNAILETSGGEIVAGLVQGSVRAGTAGGDIVLRGAGADVIAETAGGQIRIGESGGSVRAQTAGGSIHLDGARGPIKVETAGGSINIYGVQSAVQAATAGGSIQAQIAARRESFGASLLETSFGDIEVYLPADLPLTIEATIEQAIGHKILTDFPLKIEGEEQIFHEGTVRGHGQLNGGGQVLRIHTVSGNIEIHKLDAQMLERLQQKQEELRKRWQELQQKREERRRLREEKRKAPQPEP